jgi:hypothetical protein
MYNFSILRNLKKMGSVVCLTMKGRQLERNFEELKPVSILNLFDVFVAVFFLVSIDLFVGN